MTNPHDIGRRFSIPGRLVLVGLATVALGFLPSCGPRKAPDSKRRAVDGHIARTIAGQFPSHGSVYSSKEAEIMRARLAEDPNNIPARQQLAEALARLNKFNEAFSELEKLASLRPGRFETLFLKAQLLENMGKLPDAVAAAQEAVELQPSGHHHVGPYFLNRYQWKLARTQNPALPLNFLGTPYTGGPAAVAKAEAFNYQHLLGLLELFPSFSDGHMTLGDWLSHQNNDQLAVRAYLRALQLASGDQDKARISKRLAAIEKKWKDKALESDAYVFDPEYRTRIAEEFKAVADWKTQYELREQELVRSLPAAPPLAPEDAGDAVKAAALKAHLNALGAMRLPDSGEVLEQMRRRNYSGPAYYHAGLVAAEPPRWQFLTGGSPYMWALACAGLLGLVFAYRKLSTTRTRKRYQI